MKPTLLALLVLLGASGIAAGVNRTYHVELKDTGAQLLWSHDEAYLFVGTRQLGWDFSYLRLAGEVLLQLGGNVTPAQHAPASTTVFRITPERIDRQVLGNTKWPLDGVVFESRVHIDSRWQWTGDRFERTTPEEERRLSEAMSRAPSGFRDYVNVNGWSNRRFMPSPWPGHEQALPFSLGDRPATLLVVTETPELSHIDLQIDGNKRERLLSLDERLRWIGMAEYRAMFSAPSRPLQ